MAADLRTRLLSRLLIDPSGCLLWTGSCTDGYGRISVDGQLHYTHRVMWEMFDSPVPPGLTLDHLCRVRRCANVAHLEPVTRRVNTLRGETLTGENAVKTHCAHGHEFDLLNTRWAADGHRFCRACDREWHRRAYQPRRKAL